MIVSMRPYRPKDVDRVRAITRPFGMTHGEPVAWGWDAVKRLGIDVTRPPDFGDAVPIADDEVPGASARFRTTEQGPKYRAVCWACGVTPQQAVMDSGIPGVVIGRACSSCLALGV